MLIIFCDFNVQDPKIDYWMFLRYIVFFIIAKLGWFGSVLSLTMTVNMGIGLLFSFHSQIWFHDNYFLAIPCAFVWGLFTALVNMTCTHDAR